MFSLSLPGGPFCVRFNCQKGQQSENRKRSASLLTISIFSIFIARVERGKSVRFDIRFFIVFGCWVRGLPRGIVRKCVKNWTSAATDLTAEGVSVENHFILAVTIEGRGYWQWEWDSNGNFHQKSSAKCVCGACRWTLSMVWQWESKWL